MSKGGGGGVPANTTSSTTNQIVLPDWVNSLAQQNIGTAQQLASQPYTPYTGQTVAPLSALQQAGIGAVQNQLGATAPVFQQALGQVQNLPQSTQALLNPYLSNVEDAAVSNIQRQGAIAGQNLASGAVGQNAFGGTRYGVEQALLNSETQRNIGQTVAGIQSQGWNTAMTAALQQAGSEAALAQGGQSAALQAAQAAFGAGGLQQTQQQAVNASDLAAWSAQQNWPYQQLAVTQGALAGTPYGTQTTSTQPYAQNQTANLLGNIGAGLGLAGAGSSLFSSGGLFGSEGALSGLFGSSLPAGVGGPALTAADAAFGVPAASAAGAAGAAKGGADAAAAGAGGSAAKGGAELAPLALAAV